MNVDFFLKFAKFHVGSLVAAEDFADKFNYQLTPMLLMMFVTIVGIRQYVFTPIQCWIPKEFDKAWEEYTENYCWIQDTYFHNIALGPQQTLHEREEARIGYYQWVPFVLGAQALCFYLPHIMWKMVSMRSGSNLNQMIRFAADATTIDQDKKKKMIRFLGKHVEKMMFIRAPRSTLGKTVRLKKILQMIIPCFWFRKRSGFGLFALYIVIKFIYVGNCTGQLWLMQKFIGYNSSLFGPAILADLLARRNWDSSGIFPRVTWCDFIVRRVGNMQRYSVQCVLPINMLNEKIYIFLWFWITCGIALQVIAVISWLLRMATSRERRRFVKKYLSIFSEEVDQDGRRLASRFLNQFLRHDGVFLLRMIASNVGDLLAAELIQEVWLNWCAEKQVDAHGEKDMNTLMLPIQLASKQSEQIVVASAPPLSSSSSCGRMTNTRAQSRRRSKQNSITMSPTRRASEFPTTGNGEVFYGRKITDFKRNVCSNSTNVDENQMILTRMNSNALSTTPSEIADQFFQSECISRTTEENDVTQRKLVKSEIV